MNPKIELMHSLSKVKSENFYSLDILRLMWEIKRFYSYTITPNLHIKDSPKLRARLNKSIDRLTIAKFCFEKCLSLIISNFEIDDNTYLQESEAVNQDFRLFNESIQGLLARLEAHHNKIIELQRRGNTIGEFLLSLHIVESFKQMIIAFMENLVIYPVKEAVRNYKERYEREYINEHGQTVKQTLVKDRNLFYWFLFREVFSSSRIEGGEKRLMLSPERMGGNVHMTEQNIYKGTGRTSKLPEIPRWNEKIIDRDGMLREELKEGGEFEELFPQDENEEN